MSAALFREAGEALYGPRWQTELARDLEMSDRHVRRLAAGTATLTPGMAADLVRIAEQRAEGLRPVLVKLRKLATG